MKSFKYIDGYGEIYWRCEVCRKVRPDSKIFVHKEEVPDYFSAPNGFYYREIRFCNDNPSCFHGVMKLAEEFKNRKIIRSRDRAKD